MQNMRAVRLADTGEAAPVPQEAGLDIRFAADPEHSGAPEVTCRIDDRPVDVGMGRWFIPVPAGSRKVTVECGVTASFVFDAAQGRTRVVNVTIRPGAAVPMVISSPVPAPVTGLRNWNNRLALVLLALFVILLVANQLV